MWKYLEMNTAWVKVQNFQNPELKKNLQDAIITKLTILSLND